MVHRETEPNRWSTIYTFTGHESSGNVTDVRFPAYFMLPFCPVNSITWAPYEYGLVLAAASSDGTVSIHSHQGACPVYDDRNFALTRLFALAADDTWSVKTIADSKLGCNAVTWAPFGATGSQVSKNILCASKLIAFNLSRMVTIR